MSLQKLDYPLQDRYIRISSEDKFQGTNSRFRVALNSTGQQIDKISSYSLKFASCPNVFDNITTLNNNFQVGFGGPATETDLNIDVPPGYYTLDALIIALNVIIADQIAANGDAYTFVLSKVGIAPYQKVQFDVNGLSAGSCQLFSSDNSIYPSLGVETTPNAIPPNVPVTIVNGVPFIAQYIPNLVGVTEVYIHSRTLNQGGLTEAQGNFSVVGVIPLGDTPYGAVAQIFEPDHKAATVRFEPFESAKSFRNIDVVLRDRVGNVLDLPPNFTFTMMLKAKYDLVSR